MVGKQFIERSASVLVSNGTTLRSELRARDDIVTAPRAGRHRRIIAASCHQVGVIRKRKPSGGSPTAAVTSDVVSRPVNTVSLRESSSGESRPA